MLTTCYPGAVTAGDHPVPDSDPLTRIEQKLDRVLAVTDKIEPHLPLLTRLPAWLHNPAMGWRHRRG